MELVKVGGLYINLANVTSITDTVDELVIYYTTSDYQGQQKSSDILHGPDAAALRHYLNAHSKDLVEEYNRFQAKLNN